MTTSAIGTTIDAIRAGLASRSGLSEVNVFSGTVPVEEAGRECIALGYATLSEEAAAMGGTREETWTVTGSEIRVVTPWQRYTEATIKAARDRALEILAEVEGYLNDTYVGTLPDAQLTAAELSQNFVAEGRECRVTFEMTISGLKNP